MALVDQIISAESGGNPNARNPNSSAAGPGQFIDSTWLAMLSKHRPDLVEGRSPQGLLALKTDPDLAKAMTTAYAADNAGILSNAGLPVTPGTTYLAHFAGPQGALGILNADPNTPVAAILGPKAVAANPFLNGKTAADLKVWADRKMGSPGSVAAPTAAPAKSAPMSFGGIPASIGLPSDPSDNASDTKTDEGKTLAALFSNVMSDPNPQQQLPPPLLPPRARLDLNRIRSLAPASSRGFSLKG